MDKRITLLVLTVFIVGLLVGYGAVFVIYQTRISMLESDLLQAQSELSNLETQLTELNSSLVKTQSMLSGWKDDDQVVASDSWYFISIAPYQNDTHDCYYHTLGCKAEIANTQVSYSIEEVGGSFVTQGVSVTGSNGFMDLYLPLNKTYRISVVIGELEGEVTITTFPDSPTCLTNFKIS